MRDSISFLSIPHTSEKQDQHQYLLVRVVQFEKHFKFQKQDVMLESECEKRKRARRR